MLGGCAPALGGDGAVHDPLELGQRVVAVLEMYLRTRLAAVPIGQSASSGLAAWVPSIETV